MRHHELSLVKYESFSKNNASHFIMLAHNVRGISWWYSSRGWTFSPVFCYILLPCDRWQQRGSLTKWHLTWKCVWNKGVSLNSSMQKTWHPLTFINTCWMFLKTKQWMWAQWGGGLWVSAVVTVMWKTTHIADGYTFYGASSDCKIIKGVSSVKTLPRMNVLIPCSSKQTAGMCPSSSAMLFLGLALGDWLPEQSRPVSC